MNNKFNYLMLAMFCFQAVHSSAPAKDEQPPSYAHAVSSFGIVKLYVDKSAQTDDINDIRAMVALKTINQLLCAFTKKQLNTLSHEAAKNDYDSILALKLFEDAMHAYYIQDHNHNEGNRQVACNKLLALQLIEIYAANSYQVVRPIRKALIAEGVYPPECDQDTCRYKPIHR